MEHITSLKNYIDSNDRKDYYFYEDDTLIFVFPEFNDFYIFITRKDNCLEHSTRDTLWIWYIKGTCSSSNKFKFIR